MLVVGVTGYPFMVAIEPARVSQHGKGVVNRVVRLCLLLRNTVKPRVNGDPAVPVLFDKHTIIATRHATCTPENAEQPAHPVLASYNMHNAPPYIATSISGNDYRMGNVTAIYRGHAVVACTGRSGRGGGIIPLAASTAPTTLVERMIGIGESARPLPLFIVLGKVGRRNHVCPPDHLTMQRAVLDLIPQRVRTDADARRRFVV